MNSLTSPESPALACTRCGSPLAGGGICPACVFTRVLHGEPPGSPQAALPHRVGDYELQEELARGGMGVVWRARQLRLQREVALKFVLEGVLPGEIVARRFRQEAEVAAQLSHPNIITVYEVGEADGRCFISMELAAGGTLAQRLQQERFTPRAAAELAGKLARAVQYAHDHGVLHRDLKPGNVLFDDAGEPRISDFGLACLITERSVLTVPGSVMGTPSYMAPEQARGENRSLTTASDIYGLGAILYELLAGHPAFAGEVPVEVLRRVLDEDPPELAGTDRDLKTICLKCLCKKPEDRYQSARAMAEDLDRWLRGEPIHARPLSSIERLLRWMRRRPLLAALWFALLAAAIVIAGLIITSKVELAAARGAAGASATESQHRRADQHTTSAVLAIERGDSLRALPSLAAAIRIGTGDDTRDRINRIRFGTILRLAPVLEQVWFPQRADDLQIAEDQDCIAVCENTRLRLLRMTDGAEALPPIEPGDQLHQFALHPVLPLLLIETRSGEISVWDRTSGTCLTKLSGRFLRTPFLFPRGGARLALWSGKIARRFSVSELRDDGPPLEHPAKIEWAYLCEDGHRMVTCAQDRMLRVWDAGSGAAAGEPVPCPPGTRFLFEQAAAHIIRVKPPELPGLAVDTERGVLSSVHAVSGDIRAALPHARTLLATSTREGFVFSEEETGDLLGSATHGSRGNDARFSSGGGRVFTRAIDSGGRLWSIDGGRPLTPFLWQGSDPRYLALDSRADRIAVSSQDSEVRLWHLRPLDGAVSASPLPAAERLREWLLDITATRAREQNTLVERRSADRRLTLFRDPVRDNVIRIRDTATGSDRIPALLHHARVLEAVFSPDARMIAAFTASQCVYLWDTATGGQIGPLLRHDREIQCIAFSPDSTLLVSTGAYTMRVWETATGSAAAPPMMHGNPVHRAWWSDDGSTVFTVDNQGQRREWDLRPDNRTSNSLETAAHLYSAHRITTGGALAPLSRDESRAAWEAEKNSRTPSEK